MTPTKSTPVAVPPLATEITESLYQHRLLSTPQIRELHAPGTHPSFVRRLLVGLTENGLVAYAPGSGRLKLWYLTRAGAEAVEMLGTLAESRRKKITPEQAAGPLRMHTLAVNDVGIAFVNAAREHGDDCGPLSWRHEIAHPVTPRQGRQAHEMLVADALLTYTRQQSDRTLLQQLYFIELDRATMPVMKLTDKLHRYTDLSNYEPELYGERRDPGWKAFYETFPPLLVIFSNRDRDALLRRMQHTLAMYRIDGDNNKPRVLFGLLDDLRINGPFAPIFLDPRSPDLYLNLEGEDKTRVPPLVRPHLGVIRSKGCARARTASLGLEPQIL